jgi:glycosyltransferase involved in cell wall biosynthesis
MSKAKIRVLAVPSDSYGCGNMRLSQPFRRLAMLNNNDEKSPFEFRVLQSNPGDTIPLQAFDQFDVIVLQRIIEKNNLAMMHYCKSKGKIIVQDNDDPLVYPDVLHNAFFREMAKRKATTGDDYLANFKESLKMTDYMTVTTQELKNVNAKHTGFDPKKIFVFPNAIELQHPMYHSQFNLRKKLPQDKVIIGYQSGVNHDEDLKIIHNIERILEDNPNVVFAFCSNPDMWKNVFGKMPVKYKKQCLFWPPTAIFDQYQNIPSIADIGLAPLVLDKFNDCKSWLKCLENGIWGIPTVASAIPDYVRFQTLSKGGISIPKHNDVTGFHKEINKLVRNKELREEMGRKSRKLIVEKLNTDEINKERYKLFERIAKEL